VIAHPQGETGPGRNGGTGRIAVQNLILRTISALVLAPIVVAVAYLGGPAFLVLCVLAACGIFWEWTRLVAGRSEPAILIAGVAGLAAASVATAAGALGPAAGLLAVGAVGATVAAAIRGPHAFGRALWSAAGVVYAGAAFFGSALLRRDVELGFTAFLFVAATVWATDILAYGFGRALGGPPLWARVSPKKTWSGAAGGLLGGVAAGTLVAYASGFGGLASVGVVALVLSALAQAGDLFESAVKRRFGVKDASQLIPGHGGLMDRLDGFLVAAFAALVIGMLHYGTDAPAHGLLIW
jgi:phosphatidate cytidylyltransferase